eukprot:CAMPEP_0197192712 /NCGR_PEP_ID=MMETSP1423-20130617/25572_1 /TAXON_ID=476441 /ORGANISM="Pseudo-nitzschia heimii, Strain UNC1101" /LENGTH=345 /DNA_ID=CAMNT_0042645657 /DNA_START=76 /DNA_END=1111 /DNA_ORIENTATION=-
MASEEESARCTCGARRYAAPGRSRARGVGSGGPVGLLVRWSCRAAKEPRDARTDAAERLCFNPLSRRRNRSLGLDRMTDRSVSTVRPAAPRSYRTPIRGTDVVRSFVRIRNDRAGMIPISCCCRGGMGDFVVRRSDISSSAHDLVASVTGPRGPVPAVVGVAASRGGKAVDGRAAAAGRLTALQLDDDDDVRFVVLLIIEPPHLRQSHQEEHPHQPVREILPELGGEVGGDVVVVVIAAAVAQVPFGAFAASPASAAPGQDLPQADLVGAVRSERAADVGQPEIGADQAVRIHAGGLAALVAGLDAQGVRRCGNAAPHVVAAIVADVIPADGVRENVLTAVVVAG